MGMLTRVEGQKMRNILALAAVLTGTWITHAQETWFRSLDKAMAEAQRTQKPIFLVFRCER